MYALVFHLFMVIPVVFLSLEFDFVGNYSPFWIKLHTYFYLEESCVSYFEFICTDFLQVAYLLNSAFHVFFNKAEDYVRNLAITHIATHELYHN